ncbi:type II methionyl aminopeptidase [Candidatus Bathyarchaeota archaeon]|nr:type II methionyl aminopeptidase [Candidatus Bathyarchaeota archaeon]
MEELEALRRAGAIASQVRKRVIGLVKPGVKLIDICEKVEQWIRELGGEPAFPCNVDVDHVAAHYTSPIDDETRVPEDSLVKVDIGVHVEGYIADTAVTICLNPELEYLVEAAEEALEEGIAAIRAGVRASEVGAAIEEAMKRLGARPIRNLTGHKVSRYTLHAGSVIPNVSSMLERHRLEIGEVYAVEPFSVPREADGVVVDGPPSNIYIYRKKRSVGGLAKRMLRHIQAEYRTLPFASRWVLKAFPGMEGLEAFEQLLRIGCLYSYPQLLERSHAPVAQAEHTVIVTEDGCEVTTA